MKNKKIFSKHARNSIHQAVNNAGLEGMIHESFAHKQLYFQGQKRIDFLNQIRTTAARPSRTSFYNPQTDEWI